MALYRREAAADVAMYEGRPRDAVRCWREAWPRLEEDGVLTPPAFRLAAARSLGGALAASPEGARDLREVRRLARSIAGLRFPQAAAIRATLLAYLALHAGRPERSAGLLSQAAHDYDSIGAVLDAAACRYRAGQIGAGREGAARMEAAKKSLHSLGIACPERWVAMMVPPIAIRQLHA